MTVHSVMVTMIIKDNRIIVFETYFDAPNKDTMHGIMHVMLSDYDTTKCFIILYNELF